MGGEDPPDRDRGHETLCCPIFSRWTEQPETLGVERTRPSPLLMFLLGGSILRVSRTDGHCPASGCGLEKTKQPDDERKQEMKKGKQTNWPDRPNNKKKDKMKYARLWGEYWCNIFRHGEMKAAANVWALCLMKGNINKYGCLLWSKKGNCCAKALILLLAFNQAGVEGWGGGLFKCKC